MSSVDVVQNIDDAAMLVSVELMTLEAVLPPHSSVGEALSADGR